MTHGKPAATQGARPGRGIAFGLTGAVLSLLLVLPAAWGQHPHNGGGGAPSDQHPAPRPEPHAAKPSPSKPAEPYRTTPQGSPRNFATPENFRGRPGAGPVVMQPGTNSSFGRHPGEQHLPEWLNQHQNLNLQQQENLLRREPGFNRLEPDQQQRVLNRLRNLDARSPEQRQRLLQRNEMFERLPPEGRQDVRAASQAVRQMPEDRQRMVRRAFNDLRQIPPNQRAAILNSARFANTYTPQERHVLGSLLSIEPYEPR